MADSLEPVRSCPRCRTALGSSIAAGLCPRCIGRLALGLDGDGAASVERAADVAAETSVTGSPEPTGLRIGPYELRDELGRGAMGVVYRAWHAALGREVALKVILAGELSSVTERARFTAEAELAAQLDHPHLVPIYDVGECEGRQFYAMKMIAGQTLATELTARGPCHPEWAAELVEKLARAVQHAHARGLLHRDLKPSNILLDPAGEPHITDFGLARRLDADGGLTVSGSPIGTPAYMAPEIARGEKSITVAADLWSLGAILHELLTGRPPFSGTNVPDLLRKIVEEEVAPLRDTHAGRGFSGRVETNLLSSTVPTSEFIGSSDPVPVPRPALRRRVIPRDLATICLKCLRKDPSQRYGSAAELADDLRRWALGEPVLARPMGVGERLVLWARRRPLVALLVSLLVTGAVVGSVLLWRANRQLTTALTAARAAEGLARAHLHAALLAQVRAARGGNTNSVPDDSLKIIAEAAQLNPTLETRNEAIVALAARDQGRRGSNPTMESVFRSFDPPAETVKQACTLSVNPEGTLILLGAHEGLHLWDAASGHEVWSIQQHGFPWVTAYFTPDGSAILHSAKNFGIQRRSLKVATNASGGLAVLVGEPETIGRNQDSTLQIPVGDGSDWLVALDRDPIYIVRAEVWPGGDPARAHVVAAGKAMTWIHLSDDEKWLVSVKFPPAGVRFWDAARGEIAHVLDLPGAISATFVPDNRRVITRDAAEYRVWEIGTWKPLGRWPSVSTGLPGRTKFSADGTRLLVTQGVDRIQIRRLTDYQEEATLTPPQALDMFDFAPTRDGTRVYLVNGTGRVFEWNLDALESELRELGLALWVR